MPMIAKQIYEGKTAEDLGISDLAYRSRLESITDFLMGWDKNGEFEDQYLLFIIEEEKKNIISDVGSPTVNIVYEEPESNGDDDLTYGKMFKGLATNIKSIIKSGAKTVSNDDHKNRYESCLSCEHFEKGRCMKCGCFMKLKTKFEATHCPIGLW